MSEPDLDASQRAVLDLPVGASAAVLGAPGSGKTSTAVALVADRIRSGALSPQQVLLLAPRRAQAARLRDRLLLAVDRPVSAPLARTPASLAYDVARRHAAAAGRPAPVLLTGAEQDRLVAQLLGDGPAVWPDELGAEVRGTRAFRSELRELLARCRERGVEPARLDELGRRLDRPVWRAAAGFWGEYLQILPAVAPDAYDSAELTALGTAAIERGEPGDLVAALRLVVVDDLQDMGESVVGLLAAVARRSCAVVAFGDPDVAADTFRGGEPDLLGRLGEQIGVPASQLTLGAVHRHGGAVRRVVRSTVDRVGTALAGPQRRATARPGGEPVLSIEAPGPGELAVAIAHLLREQHLRHGVDFADQAVVVPTNVLAEPLARALEHAGVPAVTAAAAPDTGVGAPRALLEAVALALGLLPLDADSAATLLTGPFGGLDRLALRRLRLALREEELAGGGSRPSGELLVDALGGPERLATIGGAAGRAASRLAAALATVRRQDAAGASAEQLLWTVWHASGLAPVWRARALGDGPQAAEADHALDGVVALFAAAAREAERAPDDPARGFLRARLDADVADDVLAPRGRRDGVLVTTPAGAAGLEFDTVVVAGLQEGVWPNLRPRGSLLGLADLVAHLDGRGGAAAVEDRRRAALFDELRLFALAASRARRRLVLAAIANEGESPSVLLGLADGPVPPGAATPNALRPLVGLLRRTAVNGQPLERADAAAALARLGRAGVAGAEPGSWWGLAPASSDAPIASDPDEPVRVSPSALERFEESAADWFLDRVGGGEPALASAIGTVLHAVLESATVPDAALLLAELEGRWRDLDFEADWVERRERSVAERSVGLIARYLTHRAAEGWIGAGTEAAFELRDGRALVAGSIDRVERHPDGRLEIVDLKTGSAAAMTPAKAVAHGQLGLYQLAAQRGALADVAAGSRPGATLLYVRVPAVDAKRFHRPPLDAAGVEDMRQRLRAAAAGMGGATFTGPLEPPSLHGRSTFRPMLLRIPEVCGG